MEKLIAKKYARALMDSGKNAQVGRWLEVLRGIATAMHEPAMSDWIASPLIDNAQKADFLIKALGDSAETPVVNLIRLMAQKGRIGLIPDLVEIIDFERKKASNRFAGKILTDEKLSKKSLTSLEESLAAYSGGAKIQLKQKKTDLSGLKVEVEELGVELSFSREKIKQALIDHIQKAL